MNFFHLSTNSCWLSKHSSVRQLALNTNHHSNDQLARTLQATTAPVLDVGLYRPIGLQDATESKRPSFVIHVRNWHWVKWSTAHSRNSFTQTSTRSSATAEKQRVSYPHGGGGLGPPAHSLDAPSGYIYMYMRLVEFETHNKRTAVH